MVLYCCNGFYELEYLITCSSTCKKIWPPLEMVLYKGDEAVPALTNLLLKWRKQRS